MGIDTSHLRRLMETLEASLAMLRGCGPASLEYEVFRNAAVKGFELTQETCGALLRKAMKGFASGREIDAMSYKDLLRGAAKHGVISTEMAERWIVYRDKRNVLAHEYGQQFADDAIAVLPDFLKDAKAIVEILEGKRSCE